MPLNSKPDICFIEKNSKSFQFTNNEFELKLNEIYDNSFYQCLNKELSSETTLTVNVDNNSNKIIVAYIVLKDVTNVENIIITPADGVNLIWIDGDGTLETGKNYIIQFRQIGRTTVLASLTNTTLANKGDTPEPPPPPPPPPPPQEISAIYFAMPQSGTALYNTITWYNEKKGVWPACATSHSEEMCLMIPQIINGEVVWKQFTNYTITDNMVKIPVEGIDEECFLNALNNNYKTFFILKLYYDGQIAGWQSTYVDYPIVWDYNITLTTYGHILLRNPSSYNMTSPHQRTYSTFSNITVRDANSNVIAHLYARGGTFDATYLWNGELIDFRSDGYITSTSKITCLSNGGTNTHFKRGFILDTNTGNAFDNHVSLGDAAHFYFNAITASLNTSTNKPYMPFGNMELDYVKFEYKDVE